MHASYTGWLFVLYPSTTFEQGLVWQGLFAATLWCVVAVALRWRILSRARGLPFVRGRGRTSVNTVVLGVLLVLAVIYTVPFLSTVWPASSWA